MRALSLLIFLPTIAGAQSPFNASRLVPSSDSFVVRVQGRDMGGTREMIERTPTGFRLVSNQVMGGMSQATEVAFTRTLQMQSVKQRGQAGAQAIKIDVTYTAGRAEGSATTPGPTGLQTVAVNAAVPPGAIDDNVMQALLPTLPLGTASSFNIMLFASGSGVAKEVVLKVEASESVTVPAGTFEAWRVVVTGGAAPVTFWIAKAKPRVVKMAINGTPLAFELVSSTPLK